MEILLGCFIFTLIGGAAYIVSWANKIDNTRINHQQRRDKLVRVFNTNYHPASVKIDKNSDPITILQYKLQNAEYRNHVLLLGMWYFGLSHLYWKLHQDNVNTRQLAELISTELPWFMNNISYSNYDNVKIDNTLFNTPTDYESFIKEVPQAALAYVPQFNNEFETHTHFVHQAYDMYQTDPTHDLPIHHVENLTSDHIANYSDNMDVDFIETHVDQHYNMDGTFDVDFIETHVEHDMNFFPFLMTEPQFNQADATYQSPIPNL